MLKVIDSFLNEITMYKVVLFGLLLLTGIVFLFSMTQVLFYTPLSLLLSLVILFITCIVSNRLFAGVLRVPSNVESAQITALILFFIMAPVVTRFDALSVFAAGIVAMASKYVFAWQRKHIFNPAAISVFLLGLFGNGNVYWWIGADVLLPFVALIGFLIVRKIRKFSFVGIFLATSLATITLFSMKNGVAIQQSIPEAFISWPLVFFATVMLTEPITMPPRKHLQLLLGALVGVLFGSQFAIGPLFSTPEFSLLVGNIFSYIVSPKQRLLLTLKEKVALSSDITEFVFTSRTKQSFLPGQYMEWTLGHLHPDIRGNRRYFTLASSPTEKEVKLGVKIRPATASSFKKALAALTPGETVLAGQLAGDFVLPDNPSAKIVCIAGGIGVTPFRSMIQCLCDTKQKRTMTLFYVASHPSEFVYKDLFAKAKKESGIETVYVITKKEHVPSSWQGEVGYMTEAMIQKYVPDYRDRLFYLSGPNAMVQAYEEVLGRLGIGKAAIKKDFFPGF